MKPGTRARRFLFAIGCAAILLLFGGCDWTMYGYDATHASSSPDSAMNSANVSTLQPLSTVPAQPDALTPGQFGPPVESNGLVYAASTNANNASGDLDVFDANGVTNCAGSPNQCSPLWTAPIGPNAATPGGGSAPAVTNGVVYVTSTQSGNSTIPPTLYAFDANGITNCSGTPRVCQPLWTATLSTGDVHVESPNVSNGVVYVSGYQTPGPPPTGPTGRVQAFDANGVTNCSGAPKVCQPLWTTADNIGYSAPAVSSGILYATGEDTLDAYSANGTTNCSGTPKTCSPLWTATLGSTSVSTVSPIVSGAVVYGESGEGALEAFSANGTTNCSGTPKSCSPLWTAPGTGLDAVANGVVYGENNNRLAALDATGVSNCSGSPKVCTPLWTYSLGTPIGVSVANGLIFYGSSSCASACPYPANPGFDIEAFDAKGVSHCAGTPKVCTPLWTALTETPVVGSPTIANGKVSVGGASGESFNDGTHPWTASEGFLDAWVLPPPSTAVVSLTNGMTVSGTQGLDALASSGVTHVQYEITGGTLNHSVIASATPTFAGWEASWNTTTTPNGTYALQSVASYGGEVTGTSAPITITVAN